MLIDCDFHQAGPAPELYLPFLSEPYRTEIGRFGERSLRSGIRFEAGGMRWDATPSSGGAPASDPAFAVKHHLDAYDIRYVLLSGNNGSIAGIPDPDYVAALCSAYNDCTLATWIPVDPRYKMGIHVPLQDPLLAVEEIERLGDHPDVIAVCIFGTASRIPFGQRYYWPIFEAAQRHNLPLHFHPSTVSVIANYASTAAGMATTYLESHTSLPQFYQAYLISMVFEGVFEKFPELRVMFIEGGFSWLPHVLWRMDKEFKSLRDQAPHLKRLPSSYVFDHVRLGTQPMEEPLKSGHLMQMFDMIHAEKTLVYASDYPHFDFDPPSVLPRDLTDEARHRILFENAREWLRLPAVDIGRATQTDEVAA